MQVSFSYFIIFFVFIIYSHFFSSFKIYKLQVNTDLFYYVRNYWNTFKVTFFLIQNLNRALLILISLFDISWNYNGPFFFLYSMANSHLLFSNIVIKKSFKLTPYLKSWLLIEWFEELFLFLYRLALTLLT